MSFLNDFGVQPILLAAQVVNFLLLLFILQKLLYKPILKVLDERKKKITDSLKNAEEIERKLEQISEEREKKLIETQREVKEILADASKTAEVIVKDAHLKAQKDIAKMTEKAQASFEAERDKLHQEIKVEFADLVSLGLQKVVGKSLSEKEKKELVEKSLKELK